MLRPATSSRPIANTRPVPTTRFLTRNWPQIRKALEFLFQQDANDDGVIEGEQHNTYDINFYGPNPMIGILYLGALRAGEELAKEVGDDGAGRTLPQDL